ncbi:retrovirus-related pol polyprotein from transposon TNT 1-94 [Tanacetum coccineum]
MLYKRMVKGLPSVAEKHAVCEACAIGKQQREAIPKTSNWRATKKLQLIHTDLCVSITPASTSGKSFKFFVEKETGMNIKCLRSDRGGEFTSNSFNEFVKLKVLKGRRNKGGLVMCFKQGNGRSLDEKVPEEFWTWLETKVLSISRGDTQDEQLACYREATINTHRLDQWKEVHTYVEDSQNTPNTTQNSENEAGSPDQGMSQTQTAHDVLNSPVLATTGNSQPATLPESSTRTRRPPVWMDDYYADEDPFNEDEAGFAMYSAMEDPETYEEACKDEKWVQAMNAEMTAIERNHTWELVDPPAGTKPIGVKWLYKTKLNELGKVDKYKARTLIAVAVQRNWTVYQLDVKSAFLNGELKEVVYVTQPKGFINKGEEAKVYRLKCALYGLKQAPRAWFNRIESYFIREGFKKSCHDYTLFIKKVWNKVIIVSLYVDDLIYAVNDPMMCESFKRSMQLEFKMTDLGKIKFFLGVEVSQNSKGISLCQSQYAREVLKWFKMWKANDVKNLIVSGTKLMKITSGKDVNSTKYMSLIGNLMYLTVTRPDLMYVEG